MLKEVVQSVAISPLVRVCPTLKERVVTSVIAYTEDGILVRGEPVCPKDHLIRTERRLRQALTDSRTKRLLIKTFLSNNEKSAGEMDIREFIDVVINPNQNKPNTAECERKMLAERSHRYRNLIARHLGKKENKTKSTEKSNPSIPYYLQRLHLWRLTALNYFTEHGLNANRSSAILNRVFKDRDLWVLLSHPQSSSEELSGLFSLTETVRKSRFSFVSSERKNSLLEINKLSYATPAYKPNEGTVVGDISKIDSTRLIDLYVMQALESKLLTKEDEKQLFSNYQTAKLVIDYLIHNGLTPVIKNYHIVALKRRQSFSTSKFETWQRSEFPSVADSQVCNLITWANWGLDAGRRIYMSNARLVLSVAKSSFQREIPLLERIQNGNLGLQNAINHFNPEKGLKFSTYATVAIRRTISKRLLTSSDEQNQDLDSLPQTEYIVEPDFLDIIIAKESSKESAVTIQQIIDDGHLNGREKDVLRRHYYLGEPLETIGSSYNLGYESIRLIRKKALIKVKRVLEKMPEYQLA